MLFNGLVKTLIQYVNINKLLSNVRPTPVHNQFDMVSAVSVYAKPRLSQVNVRLILVQNKCINGMMYIRAQHISTVTLPNHIYFYREHLLQLAFFNWIQNHLDSLVV